MEYMEYLDSLCSGCKQQRSLSMDEAHADDWEAVPIVCYACQTRDAEQRRIQDEVQQAVDRGWVGARADLDGLMIGVVEKGR